MATNLCQVTHRQCRFNNLVVRRGGAVTKMRRASQHGDVKYTERKTELMFLWKKGALARQLNRIHFKRVLPVKKYHTGYWPQQPGVTVE